MLRTSPLQFYLGKYTRYMYNDDPLWQRRPHTRTSQVTKRSHTHKHFYTREVRPARQRRPQLAPSVFENRGSFLAELKNTFAKNY